MTLFKTIILKWLFAIQMLWRTKFLFEFLVVYSCILAIFTLFHEAIWVWNAWLSIWGSKTFKLSSYEPNFGWQAFLKDQAFPEELQILSKSDVPMVKRVLMQEVKSNVMIVTMAVLFAIVTLGFCYLRAAVSCMQIEIHTGRSCHLTEVLGVIVFLSIIIAMIVMIVLMAVMQETCWRRGVSLQAAPRKFMPRPTLQINVSSFHFPTSGKYFSQPSLWMYEVIPSTRFGNTQSSILNFLIPSAILVLCHLR